MRQRGQPTSTMDVASGLRLEHLPCSVSDDTHELGGDEEEDDEEEEEEDEEWLGEVMWARLWPTAAPPPPPTLPTVAPEEPPRRIDRFSRRSTLALFPLRLISPSPSSSSVEKTCTR
ncbi:unnamed protein product [Spirodela intermedia]|uniref:Uncharacterized protein n=1 Tax=Spirodela intermedia TaxID=51605 RepID=A0A7I8KQX5_SPIIN|nr:unnamed protein product [Spirodela intermedia]